MGVPDVPEDEYVEIEWPILEEVDQRSFEEVCAFELDVSVERLREVSRVLVPCHCGLSICPGWKSTVRAFPTDWAWPES